MCRTYGAAMTYLLRGTKLGDRAVKHVQVVEEVHGCRVHP